MASRRVSFTFVETLGALSLRDLRTPEARLHAVPALRCPCHRLSHRARTSLAVVGIASGMKNALCSLVTNLRSFREDMMDIRPTAWFPLDRYTPVRDGWYEVQLVSGDTAFAKFGESEWSEKPLLVFTHWRGLSSDPARSGESESFSAEATAAEGVRAAWNAFFPGLGGEQHKPLEPEHGEKS
jgi:hypothetical protein